MMRRVRITAIDHRLGRRVTVVEFKRVESSRQARTMAVAVMQAGVKCGVYFELAETEFEKDGTWHKLPKEKL